MKLFSVFRFPNGMIAAFGQDGQQVRELQGVDTPALRRKLARHIGPDTELLGYTESEPAPLEEWKRRWAAAEKSVPFGGGLR